MKYEGIVILEYGYTIISATHRGLDGVLINVEVDITRGIPIFNIVGLPDTSIKESKERVRLYAYGKRETF